MAGIDAQLLQLGVVEGDDLAEELVGAHEALQVLAEQVELVAGSAGLLELLLGALQALVVAIQFGGLASFLPDLELLQGQLVALLEAVLGWPAVIAEARRRGLGVKEGAGEAFHFGPVVDAA